jgi:probable rRNA maturation factor
MILNRQRAVPVARRSLELFLERVRGELSLNEADVTVCLVSDAEIARMNETFRKKKGPTDVLSFPSVERRRPVALGGGRRRGRKPNSARIPLKLPEGSNSLGDIAISPMTARRNAQQHGTSLPGELRMLILHGVLHLLGHDHETDRGEMNRIEKKLRRRLGLA